MVASGIAGGWGRSLTTAAHTALMVKSLGASRAPSAATRPVAGQAGVPGSGQTPPNTSNGSTSPVPPVNGFSGGQPAERAEGPPGHGPTGSRAAPTQSPPERPAGSARNRLTHRHRRHRLDRRTTRRARSRERQRPHVPVRRRQPPRTAARSRRPAGDPVARRRGLARRDPADVAPPAARTCRSGDRRDHRLRAVARQSACRRRSFPAWRCWRDSRVGRARWTRPPLLGDPEAAIPSVMRGLELIDASPTPVRVVRDRRSGTVTGLLRVSGRGFPLASSAEQDAMLARWGAALSPVRTGAIAGRPGDVAGVGPPGRLRAASAVPRRRSAWMLDPPTRSSSTTSRCSISKRPSPSPTTSLVTVTVDQKRVRHRRTQTSRLSAAVSALGDELRLFSARLDAAGLAASAPLGSTELAAAVRVRSDPSRSCPDRHAHAFARRGVGPRIARVGSDGRRTRVGARPGRRSDPSLLPDRRLAAAPGRCGLDGAAAHRRARHPHGHRGDGAHPDVASAARCGP